MSDLSMAGFLWWVRMQTQRGVGWEKMDYSWGGKLWSLQTVMCPLQFSSTNEMNCQTLHQIPELHIFNSSGDMQR